MILTILSSIVFIVNIPFGFWRGMSKKFSWQWFLAIHLPVIISVGLRFLFGIELKWVNLLLFVFVFTIGQAIGNWIYQFKLKQNELCTK